jgi:hypothetical protein
MADAVISGRDMKQSVDVDAGSRDAGDDGEDKGRRSTARPERRREAAPASA